MSNEIQERLRKQLFAPPSDCKFCVGNSQGVMGVNYVCINTESKNYLMSPCLCSKDCEGYQND